MSASLAEWLRTARGQVSQEDLARLTVANPPGARCYQARISDWERGNSRPTLRQLVAIFDALAIDAGARVVGRQLWEHAELGDLRV